MDPEHIVAALWTSPKGVVITGLHGHILATNPAFCQSLGYQDVELQGRLGETLSPAAGRLVWTSDRNALLTGTEQNAPTLVRYLRRDGRILSALETRAVLSNSNKGVTGIIAFVDFVPTEVSPASSLDDKKTCDGFFRQVYEVAGEAIVVADAETGIIIDCNQQAADLLNRPTSTLIGLSQSLLHPEDERDHNWELFRHRAQEARRQTNEVMVCRSDGSLIPVEVTSTTLTWQGRTLVVSIFKDIIERRRTEAALLAFANRMHAILSAMFDAVITADEQGIIETFNDAAERIFGWQAYEVIGRKLSLLAPRGSSDRSDTIVNSFRQGNPAHPSGKARELEAMRKDGKVVSIELAVTEIVDRCEVFGPSGTSQGRRSFVGVIRDVTERKTYELALLAAKSQAELANRAKSEFLAHMSHELRTPLNAIIGFSEILMRELFEPLAPRYVDYASTIYESGQHLLRIINDLLDMARIEAGRFDLVEEEINIPSVTHACLTMVQARADQGRITTSSHLNPSFPHLLADRRSFMQVLLNLLTNGIKFTPSGGKVRVDATTDESGNMLISVTDTGAGIDTDMMPRLFEPFQQSDSRLSRKIEGSGLGLSISQNLMELHGGCLAIQSSPGVGTIATMRFPASRVVKTESL